MSGVLIDLTGKHFGSWTVLRRAPNGRRRQTMWTCRCVCGRTAALESQALRTGKTRQCMECFNPRIRAGQVVNGRIAIRRIRNGDGIWAWRCTRCGMETERMGRDRIATSRCRGCHPHEATNPRTKLITIDGETHGLHGWARKTGLSSWTIQDRVRKGWDVARACTTPPTTRQAGSR